MKRLLVLMTCLLILSMSLPIALAQDGSDEAEIPEGWVAFVSEDELVRVAYPEGWAAAVDPLSVSTLTVANSEALLERITNDDTEDDTAESGDKALIILNLPTELFTMLGLEFAEDLTPEEFVMTLAEYLASISETEDTPEFGETHILELGDGTEIGGVEYTEANQDQGGILVAYEHDGIITIASIGAYTGEFDDEYRELAAQILSSYSLDLTAEEMLNWTPATTE